MCYEKYLNHSYRHFIQSAIFSFIFDVVVDIALPNLISKNCSKERKNIYTFPVPTMHTLGIMGPYRMNNTFQQASIIANYISLRA